MVAQTQDVAIPGGATVRVRSISAADRIMLGQKSQGADGKIDTVQYSGALVAACLIDESGQRLITDEEVGELMSGSAAVFEVIYQAAAKLNGMTVDEQEAAKGN